MSKAFTRESDDAPEPLELRAPAEALPEGRNAMTPGGAARLRAELERLADEERPRLAEAGEERRRDLQALEARMLVLQQSLQSAVIVAPPEPADEVVRFGATVTVRDARGETWSCRIVGQDEAIPERDWISYRSPLAGALLHARVGSRVSVALPAGAQELEIVAVRYESLE